MRNDHTYGRFIEDGFAYEITDSGTPKPWTNVVCNGRYGFVVSQNGGGFSWLDNSQLNVLTRWEMDLIEDRAGKHLYILDTESGEVWSAAPSPCRVAYDHYACRHAPGSTTFSTKYAGIRAEWTMTVAPDAQVEIWALRLLNESGRPRSLRVVSYLEWCLGVAPDSKREFHRLFIGTEYDTKLCRMYARKVMWDVPSNKEKDHWNQGWPFVAAHQCIVEGEHETFAVGDKAVFIGRGTREKPAALLAGPGVREPSFGRFSDACAALGADITLKADESRRLAYLIGVSENAEQLGEEMSRYGTIEEAFRVAPVAEQVWKDRLGGVRVKTDKADFNDLNNYWLPYQAISGRLWGRTGYYQQSGAFGFRDQLQDSQVWMPLDPAGMRKQLVIHAHQQFNDGSVHHWWHPNSIIVNHTSCSDDYLWLPFGVSQYIKETGDLTILDEITPYVDGGEDTVLTHCKKSLDRAFRRTSARGLPHIGACDWNDGLSACGIEGKGESVWLAFFLAFTLRDFAEVLELIDDSAAAQTLLDKRESYIAAANEHAWDGQWYRRATMDNGNWLGTKDNDAGRIFLNAQTWAILADAGPQDRLDAAWDSVKEHLIREMGPLLLAPAYSVPDTDVGYITRYTPGSRENGGVYMHAATWALAAACKIGDTESATTIWNAISPAREGRDQKSYIAEPYVTPGNVDGPDSATPGAAGWTWYTGSAAWLTNISLTRVLGIRPEFGALRIDPCPISGLGRITAQRRWRGRTIVVHADTNEHTPGAACSITVAGKETQGGLITPDVLPKSDEPLEVRVRWTPMPASGLEHRPTRPVGAPR
ncbi:MAG: glycosyl transferase family 36 [Phycisphaera sp.]|nr:glycosyl transferase family 36 [Phycisphaera sp.]